LCFFVLFFFSSRRRHTRSLRDWSSDVCSSDLTGLLFGTSRYRIRGSSVSLRLACEPLSRSNRRPVSKLATGSLREGERGWPGERSEERRVGKECRCGGAREQ